MDELLAEEVINGLITQDEALEECDDPEKLLKTIRVRKSMRYELRSAVYLAKTMKSVAKADETIKLMGVVHEQINNYLQNFENLANDYGERIKTLMQNPSHESAEKLKKLSGMIKSDAELLKQATNKFNAVRKKFDTDMNKLTEKLDKYQNMSIQNAYAGIFQGLAEIIDYLADNL